MDAVIIEREPTDYEYDFEAPLNVIDDDEFEELDAAFDVSDDIAPDHKSLLMEPATSSDSLLAYFPHLRPLDFECPVGTGIWLAYDQRNNRLHLITTDGQLRSVGVARSWAIRNESLLRAVLPGLNTFAEDGLQVDLVVKDAAAASDLHGTGVRLYLLLAEESGGSKVVPLNTDETASRGF